MASCKRMSKRNIHLFRLLHQVNGGDLVFVVCFCVLCVYALLLESSNISRLAFERLRFYAVHTLYPTYVCCCYLLPHFHIFPSTSEKNIKLTNN